jgi:hypothetical protein
MNQSHLAGSASTVVNLLWTSGWDSTFRLLQLLHETDAVIQPWYVVFEERISTGFELQSMEQIRNSIGAMERPLASRVLPTMYRGGRELRSAPNDVIFEQIERLRQQAVLGYQYHALSVLAREQNLDGLELAVHQDDVAHRFIAPVAQRIETSIGATYRLNRELDDPDMEMFRPFAFPVLDWTKPEMERYAAERGLSHIMDLTWFCHEPRGKRPCGVCGPCSFTQYEGMGRRVPVLGRLKHTSLRVYRRFGRLASREES